MHLIAQRPFRKRRLQACLFVHTVLPKVPQKARTTGKHIPTILCNAKFVLIKLIAEIDACQQFSAIENWCSSNCAPRSMATARGTKYCVLPMVASWWPPFLCVFEMAASVACSGGFCCSPLDCCSTLSRPLRLPPRPARGPCASTI